MRKPAEPREGKSQENKEKKKRKRGQNQDGHRVSSAGKGSERGLSGFERIMDCVKAVSQKKITSFLGSVLFLAPYYHLFASLRSTSFVVFPFFLSFHFPLYTSRILASHLLEDGGCDFQKEKRGGNLVWRNGVRDGLGS